MSVDDEQTMQLGKRLAALLNEYPSDMTFALLIRFAVQAAEQMTGDGNEAVNLIMRSVLADMRGAET